MTIPAYRHVLDASVLLAIAFEEPGDAEARSAATASVISAVNWSEVLQKAAQKSVDPAAAGALFLRFNVRVLDFTREDAARAASLWPATRSLGLSLGDRACLALAQRLGLPAVTMEDRWTNALSGVEVKVISRGRGESQ